MYDPMKCPETLTPCILYVVSVVHIVVGLACEQQTYFRWSLFGGREATTGNTSAVRRLKYHLKNGDRGGCLAPRPQDDTKAEFNNN